MLVFSPFECVSLGVPRVPLTRHQRDFLRSFAMECDFTLLPSGLFPISRDFVLWVRRRPGGVPAVWVWWDDYDSSVGRFDVVRGFWRFVEFR